MNQTALWTVLLQKLHEGLTLLADKPEETPENTLKALWLTACGQPQSALKAEQATLPGLTAAATTTLETLIAKRLDNVPLAHLTGRQQFMGIEMLAGPEALVPRRETELLAQAAIDRAIELSQSGSALTVLDVCTGSGNVALALASRLQRDRITARILAADISEEAVALAQRNAHMLGLDAMAEFRSGDLLTPFDEPDYLGKIDLLTCNPPYINQAKVELMAPEIAAHEPRLAFDGGPFGVSILMRLLDEAPRFLRSGGWLVFEVGLGQGPALIKRMERNSLFQTILPVCDNANATRAICARRD